MNKNIFLGFSVLSLILLSFNLNTFAVLSSFACLFILIIGGKK